MEDDFLKNICCPQCHATLKKEENFLFCFSCNQQYNIVNGILDFRKSDEYWCNVSREKMKELNALAHKSKDWLLAAQKLVPQYLDHIAPFYRADCQFLWPAGKESRILDAGSMWGGITIPAAQYHGEVYAVDKTIETLEFLDIRAQQMGFKNVRTVAASLRNLPFKDNFFDMVVLSGVLEWVALDEDIVLEKQWQKTGQGIKIKQRKKYSKSPTQMQLEVLREIHRVLKPGGSLYLAIENRIGYIYLAGWPDEHMNLPFICFLPRFMANVITKLFLGSDYRTYVYTIGGYRSLLEKSGFINMDFYGVFNHYINPEKVIPQSLISSLKKKINADKRWQLRLLLSFIPSKLLTYLPPSVICFASKNQKPSYEPRIKQIFRKIKLIDGDCPDFKAVKWDGRPGNDLPVNYLIYTGQAKTPQYFCKISRDKKQTDALKTESDNLMAIHSLLLGKKPSSSIPGVVYFGVVDGITILVTNYLSGQAVGFFLWDKLKNLPLPLNTYATKKWLGKIDPIMIKAISFLNDFQKNSATKEVAVASYVNGQCDIYLDRIKENGLLDDSILKLTKALRQKVNLLGNVKLPLCFEHGDYDICNILVTKDSINIVDFEHSERAALPFFDLGNLLFSPLVTQWKKIGNGKTLGEFADAYGWSKKLRAWVVYYSKVSGIDMDILSFLPALTALEQNAKKYPSYRDPYTYPMYGQNILKEMLQWEV